MKTAIKKSKPADVLNFINLLGGKAVVNHRIRSDFDIISFINDGVTKESLDALTGHLGISKKVFSENILGISVKTLERKKSTDKLDKRTSSHIIEIARVVQHTFEVFEDKEKVKMWLNYPNRALNGIKPIDLFYLSTGLKMVDDILGRIEHGVFS